MNTRTIQRRASLVAFAALGLGIAAPAAAEATTGSPAQALTAGATTSGAPAQVPTAGATTSGAPAQVPTAGATTEADEVQPNSRMGVWAQIYNRSGQATFNVKNRNTGETFEIKPKQTVSFDSGFTTAVDEIELSVHVPGQEDFDIDIANPTMSWPNVTVAGDNENFSEWETKFFASGDSRIEVQRHDDRDDRKRFFINITPPGPLS